MSQEYTPIASCPWNLVLDAIGAKISDTTMAFHKYCVATWGKTPKVFLRSGTENNAAYWDPVLTDCPAVLVTAANTPPVDDHGSGNEQWHLTFAITAKYELKDRNQKAGIAGNYNLLRALCANARIGTLDGIKTASPSVGKWEIEGDLTPQIALAGAQTTAKTTFLLRITLHHAFLG